MKNIEHQEDAESIYSHRQPCAHQNGAKKKQPDKEVSLRDTIDTK